MRKLINGFKMIVALIVYQSCRATVTVFGSIWNFPDWIRVPLAAAIVAVIYIPMWIGYGFMKLVLNAEEQEMLMDTIHDNEKRVLDPLYDAEEARRKIAS